MDSARSYTIYRARGQVEAVPARSCGSTAAQRGSVRAIMSPNLVCVGPDASISTVVRLMIGSRLGCIPVVDDRRHPIGVVTKFDLVEQLDAALRTAARDFPLPSDLTAQCAEDVMMPIALSLGEGASIEEAAAMMVSEDTHHVLVVCTDGSLVGVVSSKDVARWVAESAEAALATGQNGGSS